MKRVAFHDATTAEMVEAAQYYEARVQGLGLSFLDDIDSAVGQIRANPEMFAFVAKEVRRKLLRRFPYGLLYVVEPDRIRVLAVAHQKRRPGYWRHRI